MTTSPAPTTSTYYAWMDVGQPPSAVLDWKNARVKRLTPRLAVVSAVLFGPIAGFAGVAVWPGAQSWPLTTRLELFAGLAAVIGVADFFASLRVFPWLASASTLNVRRIAISGDNLRVEPVTGRPFDYPLKRLAVSSEPVAAGWHTISMNFGKVTATAFVPPAVQRAIAERMPAP